MKTVQLLGQIPLGADYQALPSGSTGAVVSPDGKSLFLAHQISSWIGVYDTTTLAQTGWVPGLAVPDLQTEVVIEAMDETGLMVGATGHGVGFIDASQIKTVQPSYLVSDPSTGTSVPLAGGTTVSSFSYGGVVDGATLSQIYVGDVPGLDTSFVASGLNSPVAQVTTPPSSQAGAVDLTTVLTDGAIAIAPEDFSYGPTILEVTPNGATAEGGQIGTIIGYGFGKTLSGVQVRVGGLNAPVTVLVTTPMDSPYPVPTEEVRFTIPPGVTGSVVDVTVTTPDGTTTAQGAFHYVAAVKSYPLAAASLQSGIYDAHRDLYYFADQSKIQVLSKTGGWLTPITLPNTTAQSQLYSIAGVTRWK